MAKALNLLILLGFICQGFTWENYWMPAIFAGLWFACVRYGGKKRLVSDILEVALFGFGFIMAVYFAGRNPFTCSLYIGNALIFLQVVRLTKPEMSHRDRIMATAIAITHLAIGSMVILDYSFIPILVIAIILMPKVLYDLEVACYTEEKIPYLTTRFGKKSIAAVFVMMVLFFIFFPRQSIISTNPVGMMLRYRAMKPQMDTASSTEEGSDQVLFQIQGDDISYLKSYALDSFDGNVWDASFISNKSKRHFTNYDAEKDLYRQVTVKNAKLFGKMLPTDGYVKFLKGSFFPKAYISEQGNVMVPYTWQTGSNVYEYWMTKDASDRISSKSRYRYLNYPKQSQAMIQFVKNNVGSLKSPFKIARKFENYLNKNLKYKLGAPNLDRLNPVEDFILNQKEGHCERFASALALLLRMAKIPSRVVVGYYPTQKNEFADFYNVRVKDGHAWTEAYIPGKGWTIFDATPYVQEHSASRSSFMLSIADWIEFFWYSKVVNYSFSDQSRLLSSSVNILRIIFLFLAKHLVILAIGLILIFITLIIIKQLRQYGRSKGKAFSSREKARQLRQARHFYGQMLKVLAKQRYSRSPSKTPFEFLASLEPLKLSAFADIEFITKTFCNIKYGDQQLTPELQKEIQHRLRAIRKQNYS
jgi:predicted heme/steroid binding protein